MDDEALFERQRATLEAFYRALGTAAPDAQLLQQDGVVGSVLPGAPNRSIANSVVYERPEQLIAAIDGLDSDYGRLVNAWTVWVPDLHSEVAALLERRGHKLDGAPRTMVMDLAEPHPPARDDIVVEEIDMPTVGRLNDLAYGYDEREFESGMRSKPEDLRLYGARIDGEFVSCTTTLDHDGDCGIYLVATLATARGRGLAATLITHALAEARERGCTTTTLQASLMGYPGYQRMGYRDIGAMQLWERRAG